MSIDSDIDFENLELILKKDEVTLENAEIKENEELEIFKIFKNYSLLNEENFVEGIEMLANSYYGSERVCFNYDNAYNKITLIIHYPVKNITNSDGDFHTMYDFYLYLSFYFIEGKIKLRDYLGKRATISINELINNYEFSHLFPYDENAEYKTFCLGDSTAINTHVNNTKRGFNNIIDVFNLFNLSEEYLQWESLEGIPYKYIKNINNTNALAPIISIEESSEQDISLNYTRYIKIVEELLFNNDYYNTFINECILEEGDNNVFKLNFSQFINLVSKIAFNLGKVYYQNNIRWYYLDDETYRIYNLNVNNVQTLIDSIKNYEKKVFNFKGKEINHKVLDKNDAYNTYSTSIEDSEGNFNTNYICSPSIVLEVYYAILVNMRMEFFFNLSEIK